MYRIWVTKKNYFDYEALCPSLAIKSYQCESGKVYFWKIEKIRK